MFAEPSCRGLYELPMSTVSAQGVGGDVHAPLQPSATSVIPQSPCSLQQQLNNNINNHYLFESLLHLVCSIDRDHYFH